MSVMRRDAPRCTSCRGLLSAVHDRMQASIDFKPAFGDLGQHPRFVTEVAHHALALQVFGVINTLESLP